MDTIIRKAKKEELKLIQELNSQLFLHDKKYDPFLDMNWSFGKPGEDYFNDKISGKKGVCFVAEVGGEIVGYLAGGVKKPFKYRTIKKTSELENTLIKDGFRGQGIGEKLFQAFAEWSKSQGAERIKVSASAGNLLAIRFYEKVGFVPYAVELEYEIK